MSRYVINVLASRDLNDIADYFSGVDVNAGAEFFNAFNKKCKQLVSFPSSGKRYDSIRAGLRGLPLKGYIVFYRQLDNRGIEILRVVSGRRNLLSIFEESP